MRLEDTPEVELLSLPPDRLIALVTELTRLAWAIRQEPLPDYERARAPGRVVRPGGGA